MKIKLSMIILIILTASILPEIILDSRKVSYSAWLPELKLAILAGMMGISLLIKVLRPLIKYLIIVFVILATNLLTTYIYFTASWRSAFPSNTFVGNYGGSIALKLIGIIPVLITLFLLFRTPGQFYLSKGDLNAKASKISWLGIPEGKFGWGRLSIISGVLIALGTILLTFVTAVNRFSFNGISRYPKYLPVILLLALCNSFCEGMIYRNATLGCLKDVLPKKYAVLAAAAFFGIGHYYGIPSGVLGIFMAGLLGWYMCRSMYETKGFVTAWIIHMMQDFVIFSTIFITQY